MTHEFPKIENYWKNFAGWMDNWPGMKQYRNDQEIFRQLWLNKPTDSRIRGFFNMTPNSIGVRYRPVFDDDQKNKQVLRPGQCIGVEHIEERDGVRWFKLPGPGAGWVFEKAKPTERGGDSKTIFQEMKNVEAGMWWYKSTSSHPLEIRKCPDWSDEVRSGFILNPKEIVVVNLRCKINGFTFFHLVDGRGWVFELAPGAQKNDRDVNSLMLMPCDDDFIDGEELFIMKQLVPPTNDVVEVGLWTYIVNMEPVLSIGSRRNGIFLAPGSVVKVDKRANSNGNPNRQGSASIQNRIWLAWRWDRLGT